MKNLDEVTVRSGEKITAAFMRMLISAIRERTPKSVVNSNWNGITEAEGGDGYIINFNGGGGTKVKTVLVVDGALALYELQGAPVSS